MTPVTTPTTDHSRYSFLKKAFETAELKRKYHGSIISDELYHELDMLLPCYENCYHSYRVKKISIDNSREIEQVIVFLEENLQTALKILRGRAQREHNSRAVYQYYGLTEDGTVPVLTTNSEFLLFLEKFIRVEKEALFYRYPPIPSPAMKNLRELMEKLLDHKEEDSILHDPSATELDIEMNVLRQKVDHLYESIKDTLQYELRRVNRGVRHQIMAEYGIACDSIIGRDEPFDGMIYN